MLWRSEQAVQESILVFKLISDCRVHPTPLCVVSLIFHARTVHVERIAVNEVDFSKWRHPVRIDDVVLVKRAMVVLEGGQAVLPARWPDHRKFRARHCIVLSRTLIRLGRKWWESVEIPLTLYSGAAVGVAPAHAQEGAVPQFDPDIRALPGVGVIVVRAGSLSVELVAEEVVVEAVVRAGDREISVCRRQVSAIGAEAQLRTLARPGASEHLHDAGHRVRSVEG